MVDHNLTVLTPDKAVVNFRLAGLGARIGAQVADIVFILVLILLAGTGISRTFGSLDFGVGLALILVSLFLIPLGYFVLFEGFMNGQTPGKRSVSIRVRMTDGTPITFGAALGRNLLRPADLMPGTYLVGLLAIFTNPKGQRVGDLVANTVVCYDRRAVLDIVTAPHEFGIHPVEDRVGSLRGMTLAEYRALRRLADRWPDLPGATQAKLLKDVYRPFAERRNIPYAPDVQPIYMIEAIVMKFGREKGLL